MTFLLRNGTVLADVGLNSNSTSFEERIMTAPATAFSVLPEEILQRCAERAAYDRENRFFFEDFEELRKAGSLRLAIPRNSAGSACS